MHACIHTYIHIFLFLYISREREREIAPYSIHGRCVEVLALDPLGAPGIKGSDFVALLGTESTPQLRELMQDFSFF